MTIGCMPFRDHNLRTLLTDQKAPLDIPRSIIEKISEHLLDYSGVWKGLEFVWDLRILDEKRLKTA